MNVVTALNNRFSCRAFKPEPVSKETLMKVLEAASHSPSWSNTQPWEVYIAGGDALGRLRSGYINNFQKEMPENSDIPYPESWPAELKRRSQDSGAKRYAALGIDREDKIARATMLELNYRFFNAPHVIYLCMDKSLTSWSVFDLGMFAQSIMLAAEEYGLSTIPAYATVAYTDLIRSELQVPDNLSIIVGIAIGYGDSENIHNSYKTDRKHIHEIVTFKEL